MIEPANGAAAPAGEEPSDPREPRRGPPALVLALACPEAYPQRPPSVEVIETHRAFVFLTAAFAYKLAKPRGGGRTQDPLGGGHTQDPLGEPRTQDPLGEPRTQDPLGEPRTQDPLGERRRACQRELALNRRLAASVYLGVVPVTRSPSGFRVEGDGAPCDWLLKMRRLPRELMLDTVLAAGTLLDAQLDALVGVLSRFYARAERHPERGPGYQARLSADIEAKAASLARPHLGLAPSELARLSGDLHRWIESGGGQLLQGRAERVVDAHGDLRPEHVCLETPPVIIDCLEFDRRLRLLDPLSELSFLALECSRLGAASAGERLLSPFVAGLGEPGAALVRFYSGYHALVRAAVALWHLDDPHPVRPDAWRERARRYLALGVERLAARPR